ncbi:hypothetical protein [Pseudorhizobium flavum]|uniref:hypothetical protein n=1 Tax=Pseudorhizobium flavum TaxID=1335061 RepID=UPI0024922165|nr:hypothetical protein [Pseudorhizobium flavum]
MTAREKYAADLAALGVILPLTLAPDIGTICDANGAPVCVVDVNRERSDFDVDRIARWIILAVNTCGGFQLEQSS